MYCHTASSSKSYIAYHHCHLCSLSRPCCTINKNVHSRARPSKDYITYWTPLPLVESQQNLTLVAHLPQAVGFSLQVNDWTLCILARVSRVVMITQSHSPHCGWDLGDDHWVLNFRLKTHVGSCMQEHRSMVIWR